MRRRSTRTQQMETTCPATVAAGTVDRQIDSLNARSRFSLCKRYELLEGCQDPAIAIRVGDHRRAISPRLILGIGHAGPGLAGLPSGAIDVPYVRIQCRRSSACGGRIPTANQHDHGVTVAHLCVSHLTIAVGKHYTAGKREGT